LNLNNNNNANNNGGNNSNNIIAVNPIIYNINIGNSNNIQYEVKDGNRKNNSVTPESYSSDSLLKSSKEKVSTLVTSNFSSFNNKDKKKANDLRQLMVNTVDPIGSNDDSNIANASDKEKIVPKFNQTQNSNTLNTNNDKLLSPEKTIKRKKSSNKVKTTPTSTNSKLNDINKTRYDKNGVLIEKYSKKHKLTFVDKLGEKKFISDIVSIENWRMYNLPENPFNMKSSEENQDGEKNDDCITNPSKCCILF